MTPNASANDKVTGMEPEQHRRKISKMNEVSRRHVELASFSRVIRGTTIDALGSFMGSSVTVVLEEAGVASVRRAKVSA